MHIGTHKTGTTSIQQVLAELRPRLLERGILYPTSGIRGQTGRHDHLAVAIAGRASGAHDPIRPDPACWDDLRRELDAVKPRLAIISSEEFDWFTPGQAAQVAEKFRGHQVRVLVYLRNQWDYMVSYYKELIKWAAVASMREFLEEYRWRCDYAAILDAWSGAFGPAAVSFRLFDKVAKGGLLQDFFLAAGQKIISLESTGPHDPRKNVSATDAAARLMRMLNRVETRLTGPGRRSRFLNAVKTKLSRRGGVRERLCSILAPILTSPLYTESDKQFLREHVKDDNARFFPRLSDPADESLFDFRNDVSQRPGGGSSKTPRPFQCGSACEVLPREG